MKAAAFIAACIYFVGGGWAIFHILAFAEHKPERLLVELLAILGSGYLMGRSIECLREFLAVVKVENPAEYHAKREYHDDDLNKLAGEISSVMKAYKEPGQVPPPVLEPSADRIAAASGTPPAGSPSAEKTAPGGGPSVPPNPFA